MQNISAHELSRAYQSHPDDIIAERPKVLKPPRPNLRPTPPRKDEVDYEGEYSGAKSENMGMNRARPLKSLARPSSARKSNKVSFTDQPIAEEKSSKVLDEGKFEKMAEKIRSQAKRIIKLERELMDARREASISAQGNSVSPRTLRDRLTRSNSQVSELQAENSLLRSKLQSVEIKQQHDHNPFYTDAQYPSSNSEMEYLIRQNTEKNRELKVMEGVVEHLKSKFKELVVSQQKLQERIVELHENESKLLSKVGYHPLT